MRKWRRSDEKTRGDEPMYEGPYEPTYDGPGDWELASAREKLKMWQLHMTARIERFKKREQHDHMHTDWRSIWHTIDVKSIKPGEALETYYKLIDGKIGRSDSDHYCVAGNEQRGDRWHLVPQGGHPPQ